MSDPLAGPTPASDKSQPAYVYAKVLIESAREASKARVKSFKTNWDWLVGKDHFNGWPNRSTEDLWQFRGVVNWTWATVKTKASILTSAQTDIFIDPLDDESTYYDRLLVKSGVEHEAKRTRFQQVKQDVYLSGAVTGIGVSMYRACPDPLTGAMALEHLPIKSEEFWRDPSADSITSPSCRYVVWATMQDMSEVRQMFPSKADYVKPESKMVSEAPGFTQSTAGDKNLIYGSAGDYMLDKNGGSLYARKALVYFVWIKDESLIEDLQKTKISDSVTGYSCLQCGTTYQQGEDGAMCENCGGQVAQMEIQPARYDEQTVIKRQFPYGRLIVCSGDTLLYDGQNPYEIEGVWPFSVYHHDRIPGEFYGSNDVELLQSLQDAQNRTVCQLIDYVRLGANSPTIYPVDFKAITQLGNGPGQRVPGPNHAPWLPYKLGTQGFDTNSVTTLHNILFQHFQIVSGLAQIGLGQTSSPAISATEAEIANARLSDRMKGHASSLAQWASDALSIQDQMSRQFYQDPVRTAVTMPDSSIKSIEIEYAKLPKIAVRVEVNPGATSKDKLEGQNALLFSQNPAILNSPFADLILGKLGFSPGEIKEFQGRRALDQEMQSMAPAAPQGPTWPPPLSLVEGGQNAILPE